MYNIRGLISLTITLTGLASTTIAQDAVCASDCGPSVADQPDTSADFTLTFANQNCNADADMLANIATQVNDACLMCLYKESGGTKSTVAEAVRDMCLDAYKAQTVPFASITKKGASFDKEHYYGNAEWNYEIETASGQDRLKKDAARVDDVFYYEAQRMVIASGDPGDSDRPDFDNLDSCQNNAAFCCFAQDRQAGDNNGNCNTPYENNCIDKNPAGKSAFMLLYHMNSQVYMKYNANICYIDHARSSDANHVQDGFTIYGDLKSGNEAIEGSIHCHGWTWGEDPLHPDNIYKGNLKFFVSMYDHLTQRGYARNIPGSPMCDCAENMAVVTRADCTQIDAKEDTLMKFTVADGKLTTSVKIKDLDFDACDGGDNFANNNLVGRARRLNELTYLSDAKKEAIEETLVGSAAGKCNEAIEGFLATKNITRTA